MFKKNKTSIGVAAGLLGVVAMFSSAQAVSDKAVYVNKDGTGQVLLFPYYNANEGYTTNVNIVNSTDKTKAVRIRFREGRNSKDVMDFNLYMSPEDVWTGNVKLEDGKVRIITEDRTCTYPPQMAPSCKSSGDCTSGEPQYFHGLTADVTADDTLEGYIEVIEMGVVDNPEIEAAVKHDNQNGAPSNCDIVSSSVGEWKKGGAFHYNGSMLPPTGGLFGSSAVVNPEKGTAFAIDPVAIDDYTDEVQHTLPDDPENFVLPSLASGSIHRSSVVSNSGKELNISYWNDQDNCDNTDGCNPYPIAHVLLAPNLMNEFFVDPDYDGRTDWVVTRPMVKHGICDDTNGDGKCSDADESVINWESYSREEQPVRNEKVSPVLPETVSREVTVFNFTTSYKNDGYPNYYRDNSVFSSKAADSVPVTNFLHGWSRLNFESSNLADNNLREWCQSYGPYTGGNCNPSIFEGVPAIGFAAIEGNVTGGANTRFGDTLPHKTQRED